MNRFKLKIVAIVLFTASLISCKHHENEYHSLTDKIEAESTEYNGTLSSEKYFEGLKTVEVKEGKHIFLIPERKSEITSYSCLECHSKSLDQMQVDKSTKKAHWDVKLNHADSKTMNCITCHDGNNMNALHSITGEEIDFNRSYMLCSQCHSKQFEDWKGGAHGKRIGGWAPPRASMTCVNCHNPHKPHFESRMPARYNTQTVKERE